MSNTAGATAGKAVSFTAPFRHKAFAVVWTATLVSNIGGWMYSAACGWLMTGLTPDPLLVALVQAASNLPIFCSRYRRARSLTFSTSANF